MALAVVWVLAVTAGYGLLVVRAEGEAFVRDLLTNQVWRRAAAAGGHALPFWFYAAVLPVVALPWSIVLVGLPWSRLRSTLRAAYARRRDGAGPGAYLALSTVSGFLLLSALSGKFFIYLAPIVPPLAVLGARALRDMDPAACARGFTSVGLSCLGLAVAVACLPLVLPHLPLVGSWPIEVRGLLPLAGALAATALAVLAARKAPGLTVAAVTAVGLVLSLAVAARFVAGSLDPVMSPRASAEEIRSYADRGYAPLVFRTYPGVYAWHAGGPLPETNDVAALERHVATPGPVVVAMPRKYWDRHAALLASLHVVSERWIAGETLHVVAVRDGRAAGSYGRAVSSPMTARRLVRIASRNTGDFRVGVLAHRAHRVPAALVERDQAHLDRGAQERPVEALARDVPLRRRQEHAADADAAVGGADGQAGDLPVGVLVAQVAELAARGPAHGARPRSARGGRGGSGRRGAAPARCPPPTRRRPGTGSCRGAACCCAAPRARRWRRAPRRARSRG